MITKGIFAATEKGKKMAEYIKREKVIEVLSRGEVCGNVCLNAIKAIPSVNIIPALLEVSSCPYCGGSGNIKFERYDKGSICYYVTCSNCHAQTNGYMSNGDIYDSIHAANNAIEMWNKRVNDG